MSTEGLGRLVSIYEHVVRVSSSITERQRTLWRLLGDASESTARYAWRPVGAAVDDLAPEQQGLSSAYDLTAEEGSAVAVVEHLFPIHLWYQVSYLLRIGFLSFDFYFRSRCISILLV